MNRYETVVIVDAMIPDESIASEFEAIEELIKSQGKLVKVDKWGKKRLAYHIKKKSHGEYGVFYYEANATLPSEMEKRFRINENILRWMTIRDNPCGIPSDEVEETTKEAPKEAVKEAVTEGKEK